VVQKGSAASIHIHTTVCADTPPPCFVCPILPPKRRLYEFFKLEDINVSLYFAAVMRRNKAWRRPGQRQPRYVKFLSGTLLFVGLLLLLWVPLLVFSTGNPTYQVPAVRGFAVNVTLEASSPSGGGGGAAAARFPLLCAGDRRAELPWAGVNASLPAELAAQYTPDQLRLLCATPDADGFWALTPPARAALAALLQDGDAAVRVVFGWTVRRDLPPPSERGGPLCEGAAAVALAPRARAGLLAVLRGEQRSARLLRAVNASEGPEEEGASAALYPAFWLLRGDACAARPLDPADVGRKASPCLDEADVVLVLSMRAAGDSAAVGHMHAIPRVPFLDSPSHHHHLLFQPPPPRRTRSPRAAAPARPPTPPGPTAGWRATPAWRRSRRARARGSGGRWTATSWTARAPRRRETAATAAVPAAQTRRPAAAPPAPAASAARGWWRCSTGCRAG
jgi:hypothetical protein